MLRGYRFVSALARRDREKMAALRTNLATLATTRDELQKKTRETLALRADLDRARRALEGDRQKKSELLTSIVEKKETHAAYLQELEEAERKLGQLFSGLGDGDIAVPITVFKGALPWPAPGRVSIAFGRHKHPRFETYTLHNGIEIDAPVDTPVKAVHDGTVAFADQFLGYGLMVILDHGGKNHTLYAHLAEARVKPGQHVAAGDVVGTVGASGVDGPGLYFELRSQGKPQDPQEWLARDATRPEPATRRSER
jgi:septal ring factor EnvC (AmiA/AmiB activator)